jgi:hypothetical protein
MIAEREVIESSRRLSSNHSISSTSRCACCASPGLSGACESCRRNSLAGQRAEIGSSAVLERQAMSASSGAKPSFGHKFSDVSVHALSDGAELPLESTDIEPEVDLAQNESPTPEVPEPLDVAERPKSCCNMTGFEASNDNYQDTETDSRKNIRFTASVKPGSDPKKCVMVNWLQGTAKNKDGTFRKVKMFDAIVDYNFPTKRIDSLDKDPIYWSTAGSRWNYQFTVGTGDVFFADDSPGPPTWVDGIDYDLKFSMCLHCIDDVSATSDESGSGVKNPLKCIDWVFKAKYDAAAKKFTH